MAHSRRVKRTIVALGGGGFLTRGAFSPLDRYVLDAARCVRPKVCFLATASRDPAQKVRRFHRVFREVDCVPAHLDVFDLPAVDLGAFLAEQDVVYVSGGNTRNMLLLWRAWDVDRALVAAYERGTVLAGISAGALCWFREGITDSYPGRRLGKLRCLGLIDASFTPHYDAEPGRRPAFREAVARGRIGPGYAADDGAALRFENGRLREAVAEDAGKSGYRVARVGTSARERALPTRVLAGADGLG